MRSIALIGGVTAGFGLLTAMNVERPADLFIPPYVPPKGYACYRASAPTKIDGRLDDAAWQAAPWTNDFVEIEGFTRPKPRFRTRVKMPWDDDYFYVAAELEEPHVCATLTEHDSIG
jgi:hypothetical protein